MKTNVFLVESPLQLICAAEAQHYFKGDAIVYVKFSGRSNSDAQIRKLLHRYKFPYVVEVSAFRWGKHRLFKCLSSLMFFSTVFYNSFSCRKKTIRLFMGDFRSEWMHFFRSHAYPNNTYLLDDGAVTITIQNNYLSKGIYHPVKKYTVDFFNIKGLVKNFLYRKCFAESDQPYSQVIDLFTCFELTVSPAQRIVKNNFEYIRTVSSGSDCFTDGVVYYFGSKYSEVGIVSLDAELFFLNKIVSFYREKDITFIYIPHRDDSSKKIKLIKDSLKVKVVFLDVPAEVYFLVHGVTPTHIAGAYTSVLSTLSKVFPSVNVDSFLLPLDELSEKYKCNVKIGYDYIESNGINLIDLKVM